MTLLSELGIAITEGEEAETDTEEGRPEAASAAAAPRPGADDIGLPGDPVGMYLREMGRTTLLTREGEVALAKRIEAGRRTMLEGLRESPLTMRAVLAWRDAIRAGSMALREANDIEATHGSGPAAAGGESDGPGPRNGCADAREAKGADESGDYSPRGSGGMCIAPGSLDTSLSHAAGLSDRGVPRLTSLSGAQVRFSTIPALYCSTNPRTAFRSSAMLR